MVVLGRDFYTRNTETVARELLGKVLVRRRGAQLFEGLIVETEAYFGLDDPSSRAFQGRKRYNSVMFGNPGHLFIYNVHKYYMLNFIAHDNGVGGILVRAIEPNIVLDAMLENRCQADNGSDKWTGEAHISFGCG